MIKQEIVENEQRNLIHEGDLLEINPDNYSAVQRKRGYLFNDGIMLASWVTNRLVNSLLLGRNLCKSENKSTSFFCITDVDLSVINLKRFMNWLLSDLW